MPKQGEIDYLKNIGAAGIEHAVNKPFSDPARARYLAELGALLALMPPPPARLLDLGCGTGWTSMFFAKSGYDVLGADIAPDMIAHACASRDREGLSNLNFVACDYEELHQDGQFDVVVFYDSLHHSVDEEAALRVAYRALRSGGVCLTSEPGEGHAESELAQEAMERFNVTEKSMPPWHIIQVAQRVGFQTCQILPHAYDVQAQVYLTPRTEYTPGRRLKYAPKWLRDWALKIKYGRLLRWMGIPTDSFTEGLSTLHVLRQHHHLLANSAKSGITVLTK